MPDRCRFYAAELFCDVFISTLKAQTVDKVLDADDQRHWRWGLRSSHELIRVEVCNLKFRRYCHWALPHCADLATLEGKRNFQLQ